MNRLYTAIFLVVLAAAGVAVWGLSGYFAVTPYGDSIFGQTVQGSNRSDLPRDRVFAQRISISAPATLRTMVMYLDKPDSGSIVIKTAFYLEVTPNSPIGSSLVLSLPEVTVGPLSSTPAFYPWSTPITNFDQSGFYWLAFKVNWTGQSLFTYYNAAGGPITFTVGVDPYTNSFPATFPSSLVASQWSQELTLFGTGESQAVPITADFSFSPSSPLENQQVTFTSTVSGGSPPYSVHWVFGDNTTSQTGTTVTHTYSFQGTYTVTMDITDAVGGTKIVSKTLTVTRTVLPLQVSFTYNRTGLAASFTANVTGGTAPYSYAWAFGDAATGTGASTTHTYAQPGNYTARLTVTDATSPSNLSASSEATLNVAMTGTQTGESTAGTSTVPQPTNILTSLVQWATRNILLVMGGLVVIGVVAVVTIVARKR